MKLNREIPMFGEEHNRLQASVMAFLEGRNMVRVQNKESALAGYGWATFPETDWEMLKEGDPETLNEIWQVIGTVTPEEGEQFLVEVGADLEELRTADNVVV